MKKFIFILSLLIFTNLKAQYKTGKGGGFFVASGSLETPLPVDLISFSITQIQDIISLSWTTAAEINNSHFYIEKSEDGVFWYFLASLKGEGNSIFSNTYTYNDSSNCGSIVFYRLHQVDLDGTDNIIGIRNIEPNKYCNTGQNYTINPTIIDNFAQITIQEPQYYSIELKIYDSAGSNLKTLTIPPKTKSFTADCSSICASGILIFNFYDDFSHTKKHLKAFKR